MSGDSFQQRVEILRDSWEERRQLRGLAGVHDFEPQLGLLLTLHGWAVQAAQDIEAVYGATLDVGVSPAPNRISSNPGFSITLAGTYTVTFGLSERMRPAGSRWFISVNVSSGGPGGSVAAGPERRNGQWTRGRLEDILLSVLGAHERSLSESAKPANLGSGVRARGA